MRHAFICDREAAMGIILETDRLILRTWESADVQPMFQINQDPNVMEYFPGLQGLEDTQQFISKLNKHFEEYGYSLYACERKDSHEFIGFIGLLVLAFDASFTPTTEIAWRLSSAHWGQGFATEGASAVLKYAFNILNIPEIVSFTATGNVKSIRVMEKIGLHHNENDDFDHPNLANDSPLKRHVLYRLTRKEYEEYFARTSLESLKQVFFSLRMLYACTIPKSEFEIRNQCFHFLNIETIKLLLGRLYILLADDCQNKKYNTMSFKCLIQYILEHISNEDNDIEKELKALQDEIKSLDTKFKVFRDKTYAHIELNDQFQLRRIEDAKISYNDITALLNLSEKAYNKIFLALQDSSSDHMEYQIEKLSSKLWECYAEAGLARKI